MKKLIMKTPEQIAKEYETGVCAYCGNPKIEHEECFEMEMGMSIYFCRNTAVEFLDSGHKAAMDNVWNTLAELENLKEQTKTENWDKSHTWPRGSNAGYGTVGEELNWQELANKKPPEDNIKNRAWRGAWLDGDMRGYANCMVKIVVPLRAELEELKEAAKNVVATYNSQSPCLDEEGHNQITPLGDAYALEVCIDKLEQLLNPKQQ